MPVPPTDVPSPHTRQTTCVGGEGTEHNWCLDGTGWEVVQRGGLVAGPISHGELHRLHACYTPLTGTHPLIPRPLVRAAIPHLQSVQRLVRSLGRLRAPVVVAFAGRLCFARPRTQQHRALRPAPPHGPRRYARAPPQRPRPHAMQRRTRRHHPHACGDRTPHRHGHRCRRYLLPVCCCCESNGVGSLGRLPQAGQSSASITSATSAVTTLSKQARQPWEHPLSTPAESL